MRKFHHEILGLKYTKKSILKQRLKAKPKADERKKGKNPQDVGEGRVPRGTGDDQQP